MGELSLDGELRPIKGVLPIAIEAKEKDSKALYFPNKMQRKQLPWRS